MSERKSNTPSAIRPEASESQEMKQALEQAFAAVNSLDKLIREAGRLDRTACDRVEVLAPIAESTLDLYELGEEHGGIYQFPLTAHVVLWLTYLSKHDHLIRNEREKMDFAFFDQPAYIEYENSLRKEGAGVDVTRTTASEERDSPGRTPADMKGGVTLNGGKVDGHGSDEGNKSGGEGDAVDDVDDGVEKVEEGEEDGDEEYSNDSEWEDAEGDDDEDYEMKIDGPNQHSRSRSSIHKRKSSDPLPYGDPNNPIKRSRTDLNADSTGEDETPLRDQPREPTLIRYPVRCSRCVETSNICYIALRPKKSRSCDWCKRVKKPCSYLERAWLSKLSTEQQQTIERAVALAIKIAPPPLPVKKNPPRKVKQEPPAALVPKGGEHGSSNAKTGDKRKSKAKTSDQTQEGSIMKTRSKAVKPEVGPYPPPDSVEIPTLYSLTGVKIDLQSLQQPATAALQVPTPHSARTTLSPALSSMADRSLPKTVASASPSERSVTEIAELFERAAILDGGMADVQGQLRALHRHSQEVDDLREEIGVLKRNQEDVRDELESFEEETKHKFKITGKAIDSVDTAKQIEVFEATEKRVGKLEEDRERWGGALQETNNTIHKVQSQVNDFGNQIQALRREMTEREQQRSSELEKTAFAMQRTHASEAQGTKSDELLQTIEGLFRHQTEIISQRFDSLNQRLNTVGMLVAQSNNSPHGGYLGSIPESRVVGTTIAPKSFFQSPAPMPTHFSAGVPRIISSPSAPQSFSQDAAIMWGAGPGSTSALTSSDLDRQFTHYSTMSSSAGHRTAPVGFIAGSHMSVASSHTTTTRSDSSASEHIQVPLPNWTGGKTSRRPAELDDPRPSSAGGEAPNKISGHIAIPPQ